jgi:hypothetical protein
VPRWMDPYLTPRSPTFRGFLAQRGSRLDPRLLYPPRGVWVIVGGVVVTDSRSRDADQADRSVRVLGGVISTFRPSARFRRAVRLDDLRQRVAAVDDRSEQPGFLEVVHHRLVEPESRTGPTCNLTKQFQPFVAAGWAARSRSRWFHLGASR